MWACDKVNEWGRRAETVLFQDSPINQSGIRISFLRQCQVTDEKKKGGGVEFHIIIRIYYKFCFVFTHQRMTLKYA